jgi:DNA-binding NarL/FixJ family response regulator
LKAGALGYLKKAEAVPFVVPGLRRILEGRIFLSPHFNEQLMLKMIRSPACGSGSPIDRLSDRELEVLELLGRRHNSKSIAGLLNLSVKTIETHRAHIKEKLGFKNAAETVRFATDWIAQREAR